MQTYNHPLPTKSFSAGGRETIPLRDIPKVIQGRLVHVIGIMFDCDYTPTTTALPTTVGNNNIVTQCDFWDGSFFRFQGGFNHMRAKERLDNGRLVMPDADTDTASGTARYVRRYLSTGPTNFIGNPSDYAIPAGMLENAEIRLQFGALTDLAADCTAATGTIRPIAVCILLDEVRIPPAYQFVNQTINASDFNISGRALYDKIALLNSGSFDAVSAGDFGNIRLDLGQGDIVPGIDAETLSAIYKMQHRVGELSGFYGEPRGASDDNGKIVNRASPTAVTAEPNDLQPVLFTTQNSKLSKLPVAESVARLRWDGSQSTAVALYGRVLSQPPSVITQLVSKSLGRLGGAAKGLKIKTLSKRDYTGPLKEFMPWKVAV